MRCSRIRQNSEPGHDSTRSLTTSATRKYLTDTRAEYREYLADSGIFCRRSSKSQRRDSDERQDAEQDCDEDSPRHSRRLKMSLRRSLDHITIFRCEDIFGGRTKQVPQACNADRAYIAFAADKLLPDAHVILLKRIRWFRCDQRRGVGIE